LTKYGREIAADLAALETFLATTDKEIISVNSYNNGGFIVVYKESDPEMEDWIRNIRVEPI
jgi:hypothetical protein